MKSVIPLEEFGALRKEFRMLSCRAESLMFNMPTRLETGFRMHSINGEDGVEVYGVSGNDIEVYMIDQLHGKLHRLLKIAGRDIDKSKMGCI